jgi:hypothetical protein
LDRKEEKVPWAMEPDKKSRLTVQKILLAGFLIKNVFIDHRIGLGNPIDAPSWIKK